MLLLTILLRNGDMARNLLRGARLEVGLNQTQAQICLALSGMEGAGRRQPRMLTPAQLSKATMSPGARVNNQLEKLLGMGLVRKIKGPSTGRMSDGREQHYELTATGVGSATKYWQHALQVERLFRALLSVKDEEAFRRCHLHFEEANENGDLTDSIKLQRALIEARVSQFRRS